MNLRKYLNNQFWNIGFAELTPQQLISGKKLPKVSWLKHPFRDRFFADPFILEADDNKIVVLVEEYIFGQKGTIVKLTVDRHTFKLINRRLLLQLDTHLSYPLILEQGENPIICPENSESGQLSTYRLHHNQLVNPKIIADYPLTDASPFEYNGEKYLLSTQYPESQENAYLFCFDSQTGKYHPVYDYPVVKGKGHSRMGGDFFKIGSRLFRPAQDCSRGYGCGLTIYEITGIKPNYTEKPILRLDPVSWRYNLGLHTLNFHTPTGLAVIDSYGYLYPVAGRLLMAAHNIKTVIFKNDF